jgi:hypothetical protein
MVRISMRSRSAPAGLFREVAKGFLAAHAYRRAADRSVVEQAIAEQCGEDGVAVVVAVVVNGRTLADIAATNGASGAREAHAQGWLLRRALGALALKLGLLARP